MICNNILSKIMK